MSGRWQTEIIELHEFFEAYFLGTIPLDALGRADAAFHHDFTMVGPHGELRNRATILQMLHDGHAHTRQLEISTSDHTLVIDDADTVVATYVERHHQPDDHDNARRTVVVFVRDEAAPNGLAWRHAQETWLDRGA